ncbi:hypothetical protein LXL04_037169 [Taraxacum kok-saghyz]
MTCSEQKSSEYMLKGEIESGVKTSAVCGPYLQPSAAEEVDQTSAVCKKKAMLEDLRSNQSMSAVFEKTNSLRGKTSARGLHGAHNFH